MTFYKVLPQFDNKYKNPTIHDDNIYIADELYTEEEIVEQSLNVEYMEVVELPEDDTFWSFGARFAIE